MPPPDKEKASLFIDIDGTIVHHQTEKPLANAVENINRLYHAGYKIILTTRRGYEWSSNSRYSQANTIRLLNAIGLKYHHILWDMHSPRIVINDMGALGINHDFNSDWDPLFAENLLKDVNFLRNGHNTGLNTVAD